MPAETNPPMFKLVRSKLDGLDTALNAAVAEGFVLVYRELPPPFTIEGKAEAECEFAFLMMRPQAPTFGLPKPDEMSKVFTEYGGVFRELVVSLGLGDKLPPPPENAKVLNLVRPPPTIEPEKLTPEFEHPTP